MGRVSSLVAPAGAILLLVWLLAVADAFTLSYGATWAVFGVGVGLLAAARVVGAQRPR